MYVDMEGRAIGDFVFSAALTTHGTGWSAQIICKNCHNLSYPYFFATVSATGFGDSPTVEQWDALLTSMKTAVSTYPDNTVRTSALQALASLKGTLIVETLATYARNRESRE